MPANPSGNICPIAPTRDDFIALINRLHREGGTISAVSAAQWIEAALRQK